MNLINCFATVNHRLAGPGKMVKLHLLFIGGKVCFVCMVFLCTDLGTIVCNLLQTCWTDFLMTLMSHNHTVNVRNIQNSTQDILMVSKDDESNVREKKQ